MTNLKKLILIGLLGLGACKQNVSVPTCTPGVCTQEFRMVTVKFTDKNSQPVTVQNYQAVNQVTGKPVTNAGPYNVPGTNASGLYLIATDANLKEFSAEGDLVRVSGTNPATGQLATADFIIRGGCTCHINKVSGPEQIVFSQ